MENLGSFLGAIWLFFLPYYLNENKYDAEEVTIIQSCSWYRQQFHSFRITHDINLGVSHIIFIRLEHSFLFLSTESDFYGCILYFFCCVYWYDLKHSPLFSQNSITAHGVWLSYILVSFGCCHFVEGFWTVFRRVSVCSVCLLSQQCLWLGIRAIEQTKQTKKAPASVPCATAAF